MYCFARMLGRFGCRLGLQLAIAERYHTSEFIFGIFAKLKVYGILSDRSVTLTQYSKRSTKYSIDPTFFVDSELELGNMLTFRNRELYDEAAKSDFTS